MIAKEYLKAVRKNDYGGSLYLQKQFFQKVFLPWLLQQNNGDEEPEDPNNTGKQQPKLPPTGMPPYGQCGGMPGPCSGPIDKGHSVESLIKSIQKVRSKDSAFPGHGGMLSPLNKKKTKRGTRQITQKGQWPGQGFDGDPAGKFNDIPGTGNESSFGKGYDLFDPSKIEQFKQDGEQRNTRLRKKLVTKGLVRDETNDAYNFNPESFDMITRHRTDTPYQINPTIVSQLKKVWQNAKGKTREIIDDEGLDIDID